MLTDVCPPRGFEPFQFSQGHPLFRQDRTLQEQKWDGVRSVLKVGQKNHQLRTGLPWVTLKTDGLTFSTV